VLGGGRAPFDPDAPALVLDGVAVDFGGVRALDGVSLAVRPGEVCGLIGPNGAGKTTLFDVISGVRVPDAGRVHLSGEDATRWSPVARARRGVRRTFQRVQTFGWLSVEDNVLAALEWRRGGGGLSADLLALPRARGIERERRARVDEVLEECGLGAVRHEPAGSLPIGVARMTELARAIVDGPRLLLLDEPTSGLDDIEVDRVATIVERLRRSGRCAVVVVEHDIGFVMRHCEPIVVLELGRVLAVGNASEIQADPRVRDAYLGEAVG
jgi:branched-chain amino acid transport system ATP-binding protein